MKAEIIAVGTEMLLGQIVNTNAAFLAKQLAALGIESMHQQVVGDNGDRLDDAISLAESRSDLVILIGGLGPTEDDISKQVLAQHIGKPLVVNFDAIAKVINFAKQQNKTLTDNNRIQAMLPFDALPLKNDVGLAVGAVATTKKNQFVLLPGPPREFEPMVLNKLVPYLNTHVEANEVLDSVVLRFFGIGEAQLVIALGDLIKGQTNPTLATYIKDYEVTLRITAKAATKEGAQALIAPMQAEVLKRVGQYFYGFGDTDSLADELVKQLAATKTTITAAESLTAGAFQSELAEVPGVSEWFKGGFVTYSNHTKASFLGLDEKQVDQDGAVSEATAKAMAQAALEKAEADLAISFTGVAGPGPNEGQPAGTVWIGLAQKGQQPKAQLFHMPGARNDVRYRSVKAGMFMALKALQPDLKK